MPIGLTSNVGRRHDAKLPDRSGAISHLGVSERRDALRDHPSTESFRGARRYLVPVPGYPVPGTQHHLSAGADALQNTGTQVPGTVLYR